MPGSGTAMKRPVTMGLGNKSSSDPNSNRHKSVRRPIALKPKLAGKNCGLKTNGIENGWRDKHVPRQENIDSAASKCITQG